MRLSLKLASAGGIVEIANNMLEAICYNYRLSRLCEMLIYTDVSSILKYMPSKLLTSTLTHNFDRGSHNF